MTSREPVSTVETQLTTEDVTAFTPAHLLRAGMYDYDDGLLGCEAMIGELSFDVSGSRQR